MNPFCFVKRGAGNLRKFPRIPCRHGLPQTPLPRLSQRGWTLIELMLVSALIGIIVPAVTFLFSKVSQGMAADEMHLQLQALNEQTMLRMHERLILNRHLFQADSSGISFLVPVTGGMSATATTNYPILTGTQLPIAQPTTLSGSFSPVTAVRADFGNSLLFAAYDIPQTINNVVYTAPVTLSGASVTFTDNTPTTVTISLYRFYYYYLTPNNPKKIPTAPNYRLVEWQSIQYPDYFEISDIATKDVALELGVVVRLNQLGFTTAWDPTQTDPNSAFFSLAANGSMSSISPMNSLTEAQVIPLTHISSGILSNGFFYGISSNSTLFNGCPAAVPQYGIAGSGASAEFPGGFEVGIAGTSGGRRVMLRSLLVAKGSAPLIVWNDQTMVNNLKDTW